MIDPSPYRDCNRDPNIEDRKRRGFSNHGSTLPKLYGRPGLKIVPKTQRRFWSPLS